MIEFSHGASTAFVGLLGIWGRSLQLARIADGANAGLTRFGIAGSVAHQDALECVGRAGVIARTLEARLPGIS